MTCQVTRRTALVATASLLLSGHVSAADAEHALFWTVTPPGRKGAVVFGYERIATAVAPDIVWDGEALVAASQRVVVDMSQNVQFPPLNAANSELKPIMQAVSPQTAARLRKFLATTSGASTVDRAPGVMVEFLLVGEGGHNPDPGAGFVGGDIFNFVRSLGKPIDQLVSDAEVRSGWHPPSLVALNNSVGEDVITYLLDLRDRVGPIGSYLEQLYGQRRGEEWVRVQADITRHGGFATMLFGQWAYHLSDLLKERAASTLMQGADEERFMFFELYPLVRPSGLLAALKAKGAVVAPRA